MGSSGDLISLNALTCSSGRTTLYFQHNDKDRDAGTVAGSDRRRTSSFLTKLSPLMAGIPNAVAAFLFLGQREDTRLSA